MPALKISSEKWLVILAQTTDALGALCFIKITSIVLSREEMGGYLLMVSILTLVGTYFSVVDQGFVRHVSAYIEKKTFAKNFSTMIFGNGVAVICLSPALLVLSAAWTFELGGARGALLLILWLLVDVIKNTALLTTNFLRARTHYVIAKVIENVLKIGLLVVGAKFLQLDMLSVAGIVVAAGSAAAAFLLVSRRISLMLFDVATVKQVYRDAIVFSWPLFIWAGFGWLQNMSSRWILGKYADAAAVADFGVLASLATMPINMMVGVLASYSLPIVYKWGRESISEASAYLRRLIFWIFPFLLLVFSFLIFFHAEVVALIASEKYVKYSSRLPIMFLAMSCSAVATIFSYQSFVAHETRKLVYANVLPGIVSFCVSLALTPTYGVDGAVVGFVASHVAFFLLHARVFYARR